MLVIISKLSLSNANNLSEFLTICLSFKELPYISKWDLSNLSNIKGLFATCSSRKELPDI